MPTDEEVDAFIGAVAVLGAAERWEEPPAFKGLGLAIIESIWSIGVRYEGVQNVVTRYRAARAAEGADADDDTPADLVDYIERLGGADAFAERMENRQRTSSKSGILKAEAVLNEARALAEQGIREPADLDGADEDRLGELSVRWAAVTGQGSLISWHYFLMCAGLPGVKADRMIRRFVARALNRPDADAVGVEEARLLVTLAAEQLGRDSRVLDFNIWKYQRDRGIDECCQFAASAICCDRLAEAAAAGKVRPCGDQAAVKRRCLRSRSVRRMELTEAIDHARSFVVQITYTITGLTTDRLRQLGARGAVWSVPLGTGFVVSDQGFIVTAQHVIDGIAGVAAQVPEGNHIVGAGFAYPNAERAGGADIGTFRVIKFDVCASDTRNDLVLLKLRNNPFDMTDTELRSSSDKALKPGVAQLKLDRPQDGTSVAISGYPLYEAALVTTAGAIASAWSVDIEGALVPDGQGGYGPTDVADRYLADAQSNPGNSGGPAYQPRDGAVIGLLQGSRLRNVFGHDTLRTSANLAILIPSRYVAALAANHGVELPLLS